jgi:hypothetical protein
MTALITLGFYVLVWVVVLWGASTFNQNVN